MSAAGGFVGGAVDGAAAVAGTAAAARGWR
jgi:hypothetical protein